MLALLLTLTLGALSADPPETEELSWDRNWKEAFARARVQHRLVFIDYYATWCEPCQKMEQSVFPKTEVVRWLREFVLLKLDVDRGGALARALPTYKVYDQWEQERLKFIGYQEPDVFARKLSLAAEAAPELLRAGDSLHEIETAEGHIALGRAYMTAHATLYARDEFASAGRLAKKSKDAALAQLTDIETAKSWILEGDPQKAIRILEKVLREPAGPESEAAAWIATGHARRRLQERPAAAEAYRKALALCPEGSALRPNAEAALASLGSGN